MSADAAPASFRAFRHLLTSAAGGALGTAGFQTVAAAAALAPLLEQVESAVGSFRLPAEDAGHPALQLLRWDDNFHLLSRFQPLPASGDGRGGNYLAESLLVPTAWLAGGGWDAAAAFAAADWWGPESLGGLGDDPLALPDEPLPPLVAGALDRLASLAERAPGDLLDHLLLGVVAWATRGERLVVVEARPERPEDLATVVALLPLALPPSCRSGRRGAAPRSIELRTRGPARGMPPVDLAGVVAADLDHVEANGGNVVDLGGRLEPEPRPDLDGYDYVQWAKRAVREGRWQEMAELYRRAEEVPPGELFRRFAELRRAWSEEPTPDGAAAGGGAVPAAGRRGAVGAAAERPAAKGSRAAASAAAPGARAAAGAPGARRAGGGGPTPRGPGAAAAEDLPGDALPGDALPGDSLTGVVDQRRAEWQGRRHVETAVARGHDAWTGEAAALVAALEAENQRALDAFRDQVETVGAHLSERLRTEREALWEEATRALEAQAIESQKRLHRETERSLEQVRREGDVLLRDLERKIERRRKASASTGAGAAAAAGDWRRWWTRDGGVDWGKVAAVAAAVLVAGALGWLAWRTWGPAAPADPASAAEPVAPRSEAAEDLADRLRDPATAERLLLRARQRTDLAEPAATTALALVLGDAPPLGADDRCLLLQAALRRGRAGAAGSPLAVDGDCGPGTWGGLADATAGTCCADLPLPAGGGVAASRASCFLGGVFGLPEAERCAGADPFAAGREWTEPQAANALGLIRRAADDATGGAAARAAALAAAHDLAESTAVAERAGDLPVSPAEGELLLGLARAVAGGGAAETADDAAVAALLDELSPAAGAAAPSGR